MNCEQKNWVLYYDAMNAKEYLEILRKGEINAKNKARKIDKEKE